MIKIIFITTFFLLQIENILSQERARIFLSGIKNSVIKKSQLLDTSIKITTNSDKIIDGITNIYFSGKGFPNIIVIQKFIGSKLMIDSQIGLKEKLTAGSTITIGGYLYTNKKTQKKIYFEESSYTIIDD